MRTHQLDEALRILRLQKILHLLHLDCPIVVGIQGIETIFESLMGELALE
jgi:hypothetical protein